MFQNDPVLDDNYSECFEIDPLENIEKKLQQQYMHFFLQSLDIVLTAWYSDRVIEKLTEDLFELKTHYKKMCDAYTTWLRENPHSVDVYQDRNKTVNVHTI